MSQTTAAAPKRCKGRRASKGLLVNRERRGQPGNRVLLGLLALPVCGESPLRAVGGQKRPTEPATLCPRTACCMSRHPRTVATSRQANTGMLCPARQEQEAPMALVAQQAPTARTARTVRGVRRDRRGNRERKGRRVNVVRRVSEAQQGRKEPPGLPGKMVAAAPLGHRETLARKERQANRDRPGPTARPGNRVLLARRDCRA